MVDLEICRNAGRKAAKNRASRLNAGNANSAAVSFIGNDLQAALKRPAEVIRMQSMVGVSLYPILSQSGKDQEVAAAAFMAGAVELLAENPD
jgi:hypothetical protein